MKIIGITGPTGAGKTTALGELQKRGACLIDCDLVYHELLAKSFALLDELDKNFPGVVENNVLNRKKLGSIVFEDKDALLRLDGITNKHIHKEILHLLDTAKKEGRPLAAIDAIRLIESGLGEICDLNIAVISPPEIRAKRIMQREGITYEYAMMRIKSQQPDRFYEDNCDYVLVNDYAGAEAFRSRCREFFDNILGGKNV